MYIENNYLIIQIIEFLHFVINEHCLLLKNPSTALIQGHGKFNFVMPALWGKYSFLFKLRIFVYNTKLSPMFCI